MAEPAARAMPLEEFLAWDAPGPTSWELYDGHPVAMAPSSDAHGTVVMNLGSLLRARLSPPCRVRGEAGILLPHRGRSFYVADLAVSCRPAEANRSDIPEPLLLTEVLSPSTERNDRRIKLPDYRRIPSVQEILYIDPTRVYCELHRRLDGERWELVILTDPADALPLSLCAEPIPLAEVYAAVTIAQDSASTVPGGSG